MRLTLVSDTPELARVRVSGEITQTGLTPGADPLVGYLGPSVYSRKVILILDQSTFIDSGGVSLLIVAHKRFLQHGGKMVLCEVPPLVKQVLELLSLHAVLHIAPNEAAAVNMLQGGQG